MINATEKETREGSKHDTRQSTNHKRRQKQKKKEFLKEIKKNNNKQNGIKNIHMHNYFKYKWNILANQKYRVTK